MNVWGAASGTATAVNCCCRPAPTVTVVGVTTAESDTLIVRLPAAVLSACDVAVIVTKDGLGAVTGAW